MSRAGTWSPLLCECRGWGPTCSYCARYLAADAQRRAQDVEPVLVGFDPAKPGDDITAEACLRCLGKGEVNAVEPGRASVRCTYCNGSGVKR